jgi:hypothetical protein
MWLATRSGVTGGTQTQQLRQGQQLAQAVPQAPLVRGQQ